MVPCCLRAQVYSFGVLLWQMFTGKAPFAGHHEGQLGGRMSDMLARLLYRACCCSLVPVTYRLSALVFVCAAQVAVGVMFCSLLTADASYLSALCRLVQHKWRWV